MRIRLAMHSPGKVSEIMTDCETLFLKRQGSPGKFRPRRRLDSPRQALSDSVT
jgi:hypothetical protein